ncbi:hypothetical protein HYPSUDRAFT_64309 [Hypholoma sublateritium FD-334 SS-4]|uniref:Uncharacterized protein n=1 Tax=Hypholoma sublateritium (strain FD-334 SS-4) TaxID=945553 RepID=A0A0D2LEX6_HYPSF|nr:hypothetical protein HYPSUDRAFT_64309 [Hypholoma sublateritium FD-334 SS-4]
MTTQRRKSHSNAGIPGEAVYAKLVVQELFNPSSVLCKRIASCQEHIGTDLAQLPPHRPPRSAFLPRQLIQDTVWFWVALVGYGVRLSGNAIILSFKRGFGEILSWLACLSDTPGLFYMRSVFRGFLVNHCHCLRVGCVSTKIYMLRKWPREIKNTSTYVSRGLKRRTET